MCGEPARSNGYEKTWQHSVVLTALEPGEQYAYSVGDDPTTYSFRAAPPLGSGAKMSFIMYGDMGVSSYHSAKAPGCVSTSMGCQTACSSHGPKLSASLNPHHVSIPYELSTSCACLHLVFSKWIDMVAHGSL